MEDGLLTLLKQEGVGYDLLQPRWPRGALTGRYLNGIPEGSRASRAGTTVGGRYLTGDKLEQIMH